MTSDLTLSSKNSARTRSGWITFTDNATAAERRIDVVVVVIDDVFRPLNQPPYDVLGLSSSSYSFSFSFSFSSSFLIVFLVFLVLLVVADDDDDDEEEEETIIERERCDLFFLEAAAVVVAKVAPATDAEEERAARVALGVVVNIVAKDKRCVKVSRAFFISDIACVVFWSFVFVFREYYYVDFFLRQHLLYPCAYYY